MGITLLGDIISILKEANKVNESIRSERSFKQTTASSEASKPSTSTKKKTYGRERYESVSELFATRDKARSILARA